MICPSHSPSSNVDCPKIKIAHSDTSKEFEASRATACVAIATSSQATGVNIFGNIIGVDNAESLQYFV